MEGIHSESYALMIDTLVVDEAEKNELFHSIETSPIIKKKAEFCFKYIESQDSFAERLIAFSCVEGIFFSSSFAAIFYLKKRGLCPGLAEFN
jgi:ribonucleotide reductase beta subunit family protein with ferritin-like domain